MARIALRVVLAAVLVSTGWIVGRAQAPATPELLLPLAVIGLTAYAIWRCFPRDLFGGPRWPRG